MKIEDLKKNGWKVTLNDQTDNEAKNIGRFYIAKKRSIELYVLTKGKKHEYVYDYFSPWEKCTAMDYTHISSPLLMKNCSYAEFEAQLKEIVANHIKDGEHSINRAKESVKEAISRYRKGITKNKRMLKSLERK